jgi:hypothetical protein
MKIVLEEEIGESKRTCIAIYDGDNNLVSSCWIDTGVDAYELMDILKELLKPILIRYHNGKNK